MAVSETGSEVELSREALEEESIEYFVSLVQVFGLPRSIGQIYGLLFVSTGPLAMDDIVTRLGISKGSASQGLSLLRSLGAVTSHSRVGKRREQFVADLNVSRIVNHFFENRLKLLLDEGQNRLDSMLALAREGEFRAREASGFGEEGGTGAGIPPAKEMLTRIEALQKWQKRGRNILPLIIAWLKR
ncbi:MAG: hypothetical protein WD342_01230 [Verrucomicrobiales bacterium]